jgi:cobyrinic acid a,c-diamide synthase
VLPGGRRLPMVGALPAVAARAAQAHTPQASEATLRSDTWLAERGRCLRGYLNTAWRIHPTGKLSSLAAEEPLRNSLVGRGAVIGSRLHLNFAAQPAFLRRFFQPLAAVGHFASR